MPTFTGPCSSLGFSFYRLGYCRMIVITAKPDEIIVFSTVIADLKKQQSGSLHQKKNENIMG